MRIINQPLIESFRTPGPCRWCHKDVRMLCAAHIFSKGAGRVDLRCNLVQLGMDPLKDCSCHHDSHMGLKPTFEDLLAISAEDHKCRTEDIHQVVYFIRRLPKETPAHGFYTKCIRELDDAAIRLIMQEFEGFKDLLD